MLGLGVKLLVTSDLHVDHGRSKHLASEVVGEINRQVFDVLLVVGDTATARGSGLEEGLGAFTHRGPKLVVMGNHELWSDSADTLGLYLEELPRRVRGAGWELLDEGPVWVGDVGFVGTVGWYDYSFARKYLGVPRRFYAHKVSPGSAGYYSAFRHLLEEERGDVTEGMMEIYARWNDARHIRWRLSDEGFAGFLLARLRAHLELVKGARQVVGAVHHLPLEELLPPPATHAWDFAKAYLGSGAFGRLLLKYANVRWVFSGHSHFPAGAEVEGAGGPVRFVATGSGYRKKVWEVFEI